MTGVSFSLDGMDLTTTQTDTTVWWSCTDCGVDVELPVTGTAGFLLSCPDCTGSLHELWRWEPAAA
jgi:hypothetical protein